MQAWEQAHEGIQQLHDELADSKLSVEQPQEGITQATYNQRLIDQNAYSTEPDRKQATLSVAQAQQQLKNAQDQEIAAAYQANLVNQHGVAGTQLVIQAKQGIVQAAYQQKVDAQQVAIAERNVTSTIEEQQLQMAVTKSTSNEAANQLLKDVSRMSPAAAGWSSRSSACAARSRRSRLPRRMRCIPGSRCSCRVCRCCCRTCRAM